MTVESPAALRLMSYNVLSLRMSVDAVISVINTCRPDVLCMQEAPRFLFWRRRLAHVAEATGLTVVAGHRRAGAVAMLVRPDVEVADVLTLKLPWHPGHHRRGVAAAVIAVAGQRVAVASVHMSLFAAERLRHLPLILTAIDRFAVPSIIAGDINDDASSDTWRALTERFDDAYAVAPAGGGPTFDAVSPTKRIDAVFVDRRIRVVGCGVPDVAGIAEASDHCPLIADLLVER